MAYKRELIVNNGSLTSYKKLLKVSDVCQLLDKSKYPATRISNGITFTHNGDGTITANGTTSSARASYFVNDVPAAEGHIYLLTGVADVAENSSKFFLNSFFANNTSWLKDNILYAGNEATIFPYVAGATIIRTQIAVEPNATANNLIFKPQLFDLTEMYGEGNEPSTVAEFKAKFPNELYDYSPRCWVKSYKTGLIAWTKNLFDINALTPYTPETLPEHTAGRYNGNIITKSDVGTSIANGNTLLKVLCPNLVAGERYILHFDTNGTGSQANIIYLNETDTVWRNGETHVVTEAELNGTVFFYGNYPSLDVATISNFQIEKGTTATDYVPYGYL